MARKFLLPVLILATTFLSFSLLLPASDTAYAQSGGIQSDNSGSGGIRKDNSGSGGIQKETIDLKNPFAFGTVEELVNKILDIVIKVGTVLALFFLIYAGFLYVTAGGNETKLKAAHATFLATLIGVAIILGAKAISVLLQNTANTFIK